MANYLSSVEINKDIVLFAINGAAAIEITDTLLINELNRLGIK